MYTIREYWGFNGEYQEPRWAISDAAGNLLSAATGIGVMAFIGRAYAEEFCQSLNES